MSSRFLVLIAVSIISCWDIFWLNLISLPFGWYLNINFFISPILLATLIALLWQNSNDCRRFSLFLLSICVSYVTQETVAMISRGQPGLVAFLAGLKLQGMRTIVGSIILFGLRWAPLPVSLRFSCRLSSIILALTIALSLIAFLFPPRIWSGDLAFTWSSPPHRGLLSFKESYHRHWISNHLYSDQMVYTDWSRLSREYAVILAIGLGTWIIIRRREQNGTIPVPFYLQFKPA